MKRIDCILPSILFVSFLTVGFALAQTDVQGSKDHPVITHMPDYYISQYTVSEFAGFDPTVIGGKEVHWEGKVYSYGYSREEVAGPSVCCRSCETTKRRSSGPAERSSAAMKGGWQPRSEREAP